MRYGYLWGIGPIPVMMAARELTFFRGPKLLESRWLADNGQKALNLV